MGLRLSKIEGMGELKWACPLCSCISFRTDIGRGNRYEHADIYAGARIPVRIAEVRCTEQSAAYTFGAASLAGSMRVCAITTLSAASFPGTLLATCQILSGMLGKNRNSPEIPDAGTAA